MNLIAQFEPSHHVLTTSEGLGSNTIYDIKQLPSGEMIIGHEKGLSLFNGYKVVPFTGKQGSPLRNIVPLDDSRILVSNFVDQFFIASKDSLKVVPVNDDFEKEFNYSTYYKTGASVYRVNYSKIIQIDFSEQLTQQLVFQMNENENIYSYCPVDDKKSYIRTNKNVYRFDHESHQTIPVLKEDGIPKFLFTFEDDTYLFNATENELCRLEDDLYQKRSLEEFNGLDKVTWFFETSERYLLIGTFGGLYVYDSSFDFVGKYYEGYQISCITETSEGEIWLGTLNDGVFRIPDLSHAFILNRGSILESKEKISNVFVSKEGAFTIGTFDGRLIQLDAEGKEEWSFDFQLTDEIQGLLVEDSIYVFCKNLNTLDLNHKRGTTYPLIFPIKDLVKVEDEFYYATSLGIVHSNKHGKIEQAIFREYWIRDVEFFSPYLLAASSGGILVIDTSSNALMNEKLYTPEEQIILFNGRNLKKIHDNYYFISDDGIYRLFPNGLERVWDYLTEGIVGFTIIDEACYLTDGKDVKIVTEGGVEVLDASKGLIGDDIQKLDQSQGRLLVIGKEQVQCFALPVIKNKVQPVVRYELLEGSFTGNAQGLVSDYVQNALVIQFSVLPNIKSQGKNQLFYRFVELQSDWQILTADQEYILKEERLPYGTYTLEYFVKNEDGMTSNIQEITLTINPPYYLRWWFLLLVLCLVLTVIFIAYKWRISVIKRNNFREMEREKLKIAALQSELKALRSQMNPHFIFNTLGVIQSKILNDDSKGAYNNLSTFSKLLRQALLFTEKEFITLKDELDFIENYVKLEQARMSEPFSFELVLNPEIDLNLTFPSLLTQPFVENAIRHGLMHKTNARKILKMELVGSNTDFKLIVTDNGVGRKRSKEINETLRKNHTSFATQAMNSRVEMINQSQTYQWSVRIQDLTEGTSVIIHQKRTK